MAVFSARGGVRNQIDAGVGRGYEQIRAPPMTFVYEAACATTVCMRVTASKAEVAEASASHDRAAPTISAE